jgi:hypothetical protein
MSRYTLKRGPQSGYTRTKGSSQGFLTYYTIAVRSGPNTVKHKAYDSTTSALIASAETLEVLESKCQFLGYRKEDIA